MDWLKLVHKDAKVERPDVHTGDDVRVWFKIREGGKERLAHFEGVVIRVRGNAVERTFTVRRLTHGEGVERVFPLDAKAVDKIEVLRHGRTRRNRIYFLRRVIKRTRLATVDSRPQQRRSGTAEAEQSSAPQAEPMAEPEGTIESQVIQS